jgi:protein-ribulosamine 3-kinase
VLNSGEAKNTVPEWKCHHTCFLFCDIHNDKMLTPVQRDTLRDSITVNTGDDSAWEGVRSIGGGSINNAFCITTKKAKYFVKENDAARYPGMFEAEKTGLEWMGKSGGPNVPAVIATPVAGGSAFLIMEWLEAGKRSEGQAITFGNKLARMHQNRSPHFGFHQNNYIGSLHQSNTLHENGAEFFIEERIRPQAEMAFASGKLSPSERGTFEKLYKNIPDILPDEPPALLHGDLWSGNYVTGPDGEAWLIDPAVYYGNREADLAMTRLFGGFDEQFYTGYEEVFPLSHGWKDRMDLFNLYPLLVHVNLFGSGYVNQALTVLRRYA